MVVAPHDPTDHEPHTEVLVLGTGRDGDASEATWFARVRHLAALAALVVVVASVAVVGYPGPWTVAPEHAVAPSYGYEVSFGTFEPVTISGTGTEVVSLPATWAAGARCGIITVDFAGPGRFELAIEDGPDLLRVVDRRLVAANHLAVRGPYHGTVLFGDTFLADLSSGSHVGARSWDLSVSTEPDGTGPWTATIAPVSAAEELAAEVSGTEDDVFLYDGELASIHLRHRPPCRPDSFGLAQWLLDRRAGELPRMAQLYVFPGPSVVAVAADGRWRATVR